MTTKEKMSLKSKAKWAKVDPKVRSLLMSKLAKKRWVNVSKEERSKYFKKIRKIQHAKSKSV